MTINGINSKGLIDARNAQNVSEALMASLKNKTVDYSKVNLQGFNRPTLGVDFYNSKTDINLQRQIAIANSGAMNTAVNLASVQNLNAIAAQQAYAANNIQDTLGGKIAIDPVQTDNIFVTKTQEGANTINVFETDKDKKGSNPFSFENLFSGSKKED